MNPTINCKTLEITINRIGNILKMLSKTTNNQKKTISEIKGKGS